ncbi:hypothetical protein PQR66_07550 [Paraburkholderia agricolaris]|uniref:Response regulatory domain-containing protein n=1 Tax=Paraburkholderia agricolaris TaxID=2152888 RepID=A0ABW8ZI39_9BURK
MNILILEDDDEKYSRVERVVTESGNALQRIWRAENIAQARNLLAEHKFSVLILDVRVPYRTNEPADDGAGVALLKEIVIDAAGQPPTHVVGLTGHADVHTVHSEVFRRHGWVLLEYSATSPEWANSLASYLSHATAVARVSDDGDAFDVAIITALPSPELSELRRVFPELQGPTKLDAKTLAWHGTIALTSGRPIRIVAVHSWQMGLTAAALLAERVLGRYKPKVLAMTGICAGRRDKVQLGDVVIATQSWEWQGGKLTEDDGNQHLMAAPEPCRASGALLAAARALKGRPGCEALISQLPPIAPQNLGWTLREGPMLSGLSVVAAKDVMVEVTKQHRGYLALEMEAYAIYAAATFSAHSCEAVVIKGVCDFGENDKDDSMQLVAAERSAKVLRALLSEFLS